MKQRERIVALLAFALALGAAVPVFAADGDKITADGPSAVADNGSNAVGSGSLNGNHVDTDIRNETENTTATGNNTGLQDSANGNDFSRTENETRTENTTANGNNLGLQVSDSGNGNNLSTNNSADNGAIVATDDSDVHTTKDSNNHTDVDVDKDSNNHIDIDKDTDVDVRKTEVELNFNLSNTRAADGSAAATGGDASVANSNNTAITNTAGDNGIVASTGADVDADYNSNNRNEAEEGSVAVLGSGTANVDSSRHDSHDTTITIKDVTVEVASSDLDGTVTGNAMTFAKRAAGPGTGATTLEGHALANASGIVVLSQNTGMTSLVQQSVNVQVNK